jgi:hypothetical protein
MVCHVFLDMLKRLGVSLTMLAVCGHFCWAQPLTLNYGVNNVDINADGVNDMIVRTRWENMNAHSFDRYLITITLDGLEYSGAKIYEVPLDESYDYTKTYCEAAMMITTYYRLTPTGGQDVGVPYFYLKQVKQKRSFKQYADMGRFM